MASSAAASPRTTGARSRVELDLSQPADFAALTELLATADVLVSNLRPGSLERLGLGREVCAERFPALVVCEISGFGQTGPYAQWPAFDSAIQAMSGLSSLLGPSADDPPGLRADGDHGRAGRRVCRRGHTSWRWSGGNAPGVARTSTHPCTTSALRSSSARSHSTSSPGTCRSAVPTGSARWAASEAGDGGWISMVIPTEEMWRRCCAAIDRPDLVDAPELDDT